MDPLKYLDIHSKEILEDCEDIKSVGEGEVLIKEIKLLISDLKDIRISQRKTIVRCKVLIKRFENHNSNSKQKDSGINYRGREEFDSWAFLFTKWIIASLKSDDTYTYAYNFIVQFFNRKSGLLPINIKDDADIAERLYLEKKDDDEMSSLVFFFIDKKIGTNLISYLKEQYSNSKPNRIALMIFALIKLGLVHKTMTDNQTILYKYLKNDFGEIGERQSLNNNITKLRNTTHSPDIAEIDKHSSIIKEFLLKIGSKK